MLDFGEAVRRFYGNYTNPDGRAQRSAYWWVQLYQTIIITVLGIVILMADGGVSFIESFLKLSTLEEFTVLWTDLGASGKMAVWTVLIFSLVNFLPGIMLAIRRFHDLNFSGWLVMIFFIIGMIPFVGNFAGLANFIWFIFPGTNGPNTYGPDPLDKHDDIFG